MTLKERYKNLVEYFEANMPNPETELSYSNPYELLVAVILSAQCTDKRVNMVTPELFKRFPNATTLSRSDSDEVFEYIKSISYPNNKAKHLVGMAKILVEEFNNVVPDSIDDLTKMPGVGRKTANVIASVIHNQPTMAVDTHVFRVSHRLGLVSLKAKTPLLVEKQLVKLFDEIIIPKAHHWLILHGRYTCLARNPKCSECGITALCKSYEKIQKLGIVEVDKKLPSIN
ncbi:endonuclease III [Lacihabitans soyangensis]|jgi:endonuclease III|uniref:Endonuclease III n=1 Tax=Lacihabitans soyangensis TaxID=869394 RepID=A0AAE3H1X7_9BACT|nr:endonuclease III [Lacihabitans soyangensis]MCP9761325.1 endonuclease III [Lacihabitans soyangensis]